jgi:hypothetical protein
MTNPDTRAACLVPALVIACAIGSAACTPKSSPVLKKEVSFLVTGDPGVPVAGVDLLLNERSLAQTSAQGTALVTLTGHEGDAFDLLVRCPSDFQSPGEATRVVVHRLAGNKRTEYTATCAPRTRTIIVAVNGMKGHRLPVMSLGRVVGETDDSGVATIAVRVAPNDQFEMALDTSAPEDALLRPRNPVATFTAKNEDDVFVFNPEFTLAPRPRPVVSRRPTPVAGPPIPIRIQ